MTQDFQVNSKSKREASRPTFATSGHAAHLMSALAVKALTRTMSDCALIAMRPVAAQITTTKAQLCYLRP